MSVICPRPPDEGSRANCRDAIERFLERSWLLERLSLQAMNGHRFALTLLDQWLQKHRIVTLSGASVRDVRAMLRSPHWDEMSRRCEALLGVVTRFYQSLRDCKFRCDDPIETLIEQEISAAARSRHASRPRRVERSRHLVFSRSPVA
jgi:site-specific recombinase XerD